MGLCGGCRGICCRGMLGFCEVVEERGGEDFAGGCEGGFLGEGEGVQAGEEGVNVVWGKEGGWEGHVGCGNE